MSFRNYAPQGGIRIDARTGQAKQQGIRNTHRDTRGNIIGGVDADGQRFGTKATNGGGAQTPGVSQSATPRLDAGVQTPRLDAMRDPAAAGESFAQTDARKRQASTLAGNFGSGPQNLAQRQQLFKDMQMVGGGAMTPDMKSRATKLGVKPNRFDAVARKIPKAAGAVAAGGQPALSPLRQPAAAPAPGIIPAPVDPVLPPVANIQRQSPSWRGRMS
ncbi:MAG: hypothetical protein RLZZ214_396 [Verrucomicrobiota bacterium]|jgi:hypothetical protein